MASKGALIILKVMRKGDRTMSSGTMRLLESMDHSTVKEYRIRDGKIEATILDCASDQENPWVGALARATENPR